MDIIVYDKSLNKIGLIDSFTSLRWIRRYSKNGEFELQLPLTSEALDLLKKDNVICKIDDDEAAFIEHRQLKQNEDGSEILVIRGKFIPGYFNRRINWEQLFFKGKLEECCRAMVTKNCIAPVNKNRIIPNLVLGEMLNIPIDINYQNSYGDLLQEIEIITGSNDVGFKVIFDKKNRKFIFKLYKGKDLSSNQSINSRCIFSKEFENIIEQDYTDSINNYKNTALVVGAGDGANVKSIIVNDTAAGLNRFEVFIDAKDLTNKVYSDSKEISISDTDYMTLLSQRGNEKLSECKEITTFDSKINLRSNLSYRVDFDLGDIVTCINKKWGIKSNARITEIEEIYDMNGLNINVTFGKGVPTLIDKIKSKLR